MQKSVDDLDHERFMWEAMKEAELALQHSTRPIGAIILYDGEIIGRGRAQHIERNSKIAHAELNALISAEQYVSDLDEHSHDCVLYTTLEPCVMCLGAIVMSDIDHVVFALHDRWINPSPMLSVDYVRRHIKTYLGGVLETESMALWERSNPQELYMLKHGKRKSG
jgi:tRNA(adenine34) deaminase